MTATWLSLLATKNIVDPVGITRRNVLNEPVNRPPVHGIFSGKNGKPAVRLARLRAWQNAKMSIRQRGLIFVSKLRPFSGRRQSAHTRGPWRLHPAAAADRTDAPSPAPWSFHRGR